MFSRKHQNSRYGRTPYADVSLICGCESSLHQWHLFSANALFVKWNQGALKGSLSGWEGRSHIKSLFGYVGIPWTSFVCIEHIIALPTTAFNLNKLKRSRIDPNNTAPCCPCLHRLLAFRARAALQVLNAQHKSALAQGYGARNIRDTEFSKDVPRLEKPKKSIKHTYRFL